MVTVTNTESGITKNSGLEEPIFPADLYCKGKLLSYLATSVKETS